MPDQKEATQPDRQGHLILTYEGVKVPWSEVQLVLAREGRLFDIKLAHTVGEVIEVVTVVPRLTRENADKALETLSFFRQRGSDFDNRRLRSLMEEGEGL